MISLKIRKYRPYADVTMVVNGDVEIHLGLLNREQLNMLYDDFYAGLAQVELLDYEFSDE